MSDKITFFGSHRNWENWKTCRFYMCQTGSLDLWTALNTVNIRVLEERSPTNKEYTDILRSFPYEISKTCRCRDCRYLRIFGKKN